MRILHTSDWHLGVALHQTSLAKEQQLFLDWLLVVLEREAIDVLLVAGDIFHTQTPSTDARSRLYHFIREATELPNLRHTILVGGNHDSAATLNAPLPLYDSDRVTVVGDTRGLEPDELADYLLVPVTGASEEVELVVSAVPYIHAWHLGVRGGDATAAEERAATRDALRDVYTLCAVEAAKRWPGVPQVATGHLTCGDVREGDFVNKIHSVGGEDAFGPDLFDDRFAYVALGHIHRKFPVDDQRRVWYCGTPVATRFVESRSTRIVRVIDVEAGDEVASMTSRDIDVPCTRRLAEFSGSPAEVLAELEAFENPHELPALISICAHVELREIGLLERFTEALGARAKIVAFEQRIVGAGVPGQAEAAPIVNLEEVNILDLVRQRHREKHEGAELSDRVALLAARALDPGETSKHEAQAADAATATTTTSRSTAQQPNASSDEPSAQANLLIEESAE